MSAADFERLLAEFRAGWAAIEGGHFNLEIRVPGSVSTWEPAFNADEFELVTHVCLPLRESADDFTLDGFAVIQKCPPDSAIKKGQHRAKWASMHKRCVTAIDSFKRLSGEAGAALPNVIRDRLVGYCPWQCSSPACWWIALLAYALKTTAYNAAGVYQVEHGIPRPWLLSIELIERLRLNTESPVWPPNDQTPTDLISVAQIAQLVGGITAQRVHTVLSTARNHEDATKRPPAVVKKGRTVYLPYVPFRQWVMANQPGWEPYLPETYAKAMETLKKR